ncbi:MAG: trypsin-like peptidase domain-containing protein [Eubacterium sp.]|nr:trypsin-like peptidase domain-containing protein [Eubacterium sp.]
MPQNPSDHETSEKRDITKQNEAGETKEYPFIREVIKPASRSRREILVRILWIVGGAAAAGLIAACVFVKFFPTAERLFGTEIQKRERIRVASESSASSESTSSPAETDDSKAAGTSVTSGSSDAGENSGSAETSSDSEKNSAAGASSAGEDGTASGETAGKESGNTPAEQSSAESGVSAVSEPETAGPAEIDPVAEYRDLHKQLNSIAADSEKCVVQVTGIKSELDYFNASYENEQQVSGVTIAEDEENYFILTENTPLSGAEKIIVRFANQQSYDADVIRADANTGLAVIRVSKEEIDEEIQNTIQIAELGSSYSLVRGEPVIAVGSPMGYEGMTSAGSITSAGSDISMYDVHYHLFTTDIIGTQTGSGALINMEGKVVGIIRQSLGTSGNSIVQALGISEITGLIDTLVNDEARPYAGIRGETVTTAISEKTGIPQGMLIREVEADAPAMLAGLMQFDVVIKVNEQDITTVSNYMAALAACKPGQDIHITALRKGPEVYEEMTFQVLLAEI